MNVYDLLNTDDLLNIGSLANRYGSKTAQNKKSAVSSLFQSQLSAFKNQVSNELRTSTEDLQPGVQVVQIAPNHELYIAPPLTIKAPSENCIFQCGTKGQRIYMQEISVEYTEDSTEEDPIVHIYGTADSGEFDFVCHINDIDPTNASRAEMSALYGHLCKIGAYKPTPGSSGGYVVPTGLEPGDVMRKQNYISLIREHATSKRFSPSIHTNAKDLLQLYQDFMQKRDSVSNNIDTQ